MMVKFFRENCFNIAVSIAPPIFPQPINPIFIFVIFVNYACKAKKSKERLVLKVLLGFENFPGKFRYKKARIW
jgi:hypothetical protein